MQKLVEPMGFEPTTSSMPSRRAPNCATAPPEAEFSLSQLAGVIAWDEANAGR